MLKVINKDSLFLNIYDVGIIIGKVMFVIIVSWKDEKEKDKSKIWKLNNFFFK